MPQRLPWSAGTWSHPPLDVTEAESLAATAEEGSDAWLRTAYGFIHDDAHALLAPLEVGQAMEVTFHAETTGEFDQAGIYLHGDSEHWVKAGVEFADEHLGLGAVVTVGASDWSVGRVDDWQGASISVRLSRWPDAVLIRARSSVDPQWRLIRLASFPGFMPTTAGPYLAAPTRAGFRATFTDWSLDTADAAIH